MRQSRSLTLAVWLLDRLPHQPVALTGDLLEEARTGRSRRWLGRQILAAVVMATVGQSRSYAPPLAFSVLWSMLYPAWQLPLARSRFTQAVFARCAALAWPYSALFELAAGLLPSATFILCGFVLYLLLRGPAAPRPSTLRVVCSLSLGLNVLLVTSMGLLAWPPSFISHTHPLGAAIFYVPPFGGVLCIPLALSLFAAILAALTGPRPRIALTRP